MQASQPANESIISGCLLAALKGFGMYIGELWRRKDVTNNKTRFERVYIVMVPGAILPSGLSSKSADAEKNPLSAQLCQRAMVDKAPLWFTTASATKVLDAGSQVKTAVVIPIFCYPLQQEFYTIFYSLENVPSRDASMSLLREISKACVMAAAANLGAEEAETSNGEPGGPLKLEPTLSNGGVDGGMAAVSAAARARVERASKQQQQPGEAGELGNGEGPAPQQFDRARLNDISVIFTKPILPDFTTFSDLKDVKRIGEGGSATIYTGQYNDSLVCIKMLTEECERSPLFVGGMRKEIEVMLSLDHPYICSYIASGQEPRMFVVMEYCGGGSLNEALGFVAGKRATSKTKWLRRKEAVSRPFVDCLKHIMQLAEALSYMHHEALPDYYLMHRDLKPDNVAFSADGTLKLIDFGLAKAFPRDQVDAHREAYTMTGQAGSMRYMAPEVCLSKPYTQSADVYSWAILAWEMASACKPFYDYGRHDFIQHVARGGERPPFDKRWPKAFTDILKDAWQEDGSARPSMAEIVDRLCPVYREAHKKHHAAKNSGCWRTMWRRKAAALKKTKGAGAVINID